MKSKRLKETLDQKIDRVCSEHPPKKIYEALAEKLAKNLFLSSTSSSQLLLNLEKACDLMNKELDDLMQRNLLTRSNIKIKICLEEPE